MTTIFLCDDTAPQLHHLQELVTDYTRDKDSQVFCFDSAKSLLTRLQRQTPDIAILDIDLDGDNGIDLAVTLNSRCPGCQIIFLTAYSDYIAYAYFAQHTWFILKKDLEKYLPAALDKAFVALEKGFADEPAVWIKKRRTAERLPVSEILYLERIGHQTKVVKLLGTVLCRQTPEELLSTLDDSLFIRCHQSFWVNRSKIFSLVGDSFHLIDGSEILISRTYKKEAAQAFDQLTSGAAQG